jgi:lysozyme
MEAAEICPGGTMTIGYGRNLADRGITMPESVSMLNADVSRCQDEAPFMWANWREIGHVRQEVLVEMIFQLGTGGVQGFPAMCTAVALGHWDIAADNMLFKDPPVSGEWSDWHTQTPARCEELALMMRTGEPWEGEE